MIDHIEMAKMSTEKCTQTPIHRTCIHVAKKIRPMTKYVCDIPKETEKTAALTTKTKRLMWFVPIKLQCIRLCSCICCRQTVQCAFSHSTRLALVVVCYDYADSACTRKQRFFSCKFVNWVFQLVLCIARVKFDLRARGRKFKSFKIWFSASQWNVCRVCCFFLHRQQ